MSVREELKKLVTADPQILENLRKESGFDVTDRIGIFVTSKSDEIMQAVRAHAVFIQQETLAESIASDGAALPEAASATVDILDHEATIGLVRVHR